MRTQWWKETSPGAIPTPTALRQLSTSSPLSS
eukprot:COSAG04_NODE_14986_length_547_cov_3.247768_1_plen_31_part_01